MRLMKRQHKSKEDRERSREARIQIHNIIEKCQECPAYRRDRKVSKECHECLPYLKMRKLASSLIEK